ISFFFTILKMNIIYFFNFFLHLQGRRKCSYDVFENAFNTFIAECANARKLLPQFFESAPGFLQFLYEQNVICYKKRDVSGFQDAESFTRWCFRERTLSNMAPNVRIGVEYESVVGLSKALNVGRPIKVSKTSPRRHVGTIIS